MRFGVPSFPAGGPTATPQFEPEVVRFAERFFAYVRDRYGVPDWPRSSASVVGYSTDANGAEHAGKGEGGGRFVSKGGGGGSGTSGTPKTDSKSGRAATSATPNLRDQLLAGVSEKGVERHAKATKRPRSKPAAAAAKAVDVARSRRIKAAWRVEAEVATAIQGSNLPDSEPADIVFMPDAAGKPVTDPKAVRRWLAQRAKAIEEARDLPPASAGEHPITAMRREALARIVANPAHFFEVKTLQKAKRDAVRMTAAALKRKEEWRDRCGIVFHVVVVDERKGKKNSGHRVYVAPDTLAKRVELKDCRKADSAAAVLDLVRAS